MYVCIGGARPPSWAPPRPRPGGAVRCGSQKSDEAKFTQLKTIRHQLFQQCLVIDLSERDKRGQH